MWGLVFEVRAKPGHWDAYFQHVDRLRPVLARHDGLIWLERFRRIDDEGVLLSHQHWRDEGALAAWRADPAHRVSQSAGRHRHFEDYRIRVGPEVGGAGAAGLLVAHGTAPVEGPGCVGFAGVTVPGRFVTLADPGRVDAAALAAAPGVERVRGFAVVRDYGLTDRAQAPDG